MADDIPRIVCTKCPAVATVHYVAPTIHQRNSIWVSCHGVHMWCESHRITAQVPINGQMSTATYPFWLKPPRHDNPNVVPLLFEQLEKHRVEPGIMIAEAVGTFKRSAEASGRDQRRTPAGVQAEQARVSHSRAANDRS